MKCPKCHTENLDTKKFCRECGAKILPLCPACGADTEIYPVEMSCAFKLLLDEIKSLGVAPRLMLEDAV